MPNDLLQKWLATYDPVHRGWTRDGIAGGLCATNGFGFPRIRSGYNLYRADADSPGGEPIVVGAAGADASSVRTFGWIDHAAARTYFYRLVPVSGGGVENWSDVAQVEVQFSEAGTWLGNAPNAPSDLQLIPMSFGRFALRWSYFPQGQQVAPAGFCLYSTTDDEIDYGGTESQVAYRPGQVHYEYITPPQPDGIRVGWAVRAYSACLREEQNTNSVFAVTRRSGPPAQPVVQVIMC